VLDCVFADGPPGNARNYDNNGRQDFHAILPNSIITKEGYWVEEEERIYTRIQHERREREEALKLKVSCNRHFDLLVFLFGPIDVPADGHLL
jgi:hypothetical protein